MEFGPERPTRLALACRWLGVFSVLVLVVGLVALRLGLAQGIEGPAVVAAACALAAGAVVLGILAFIRIWVVGHSGVGAAFIGIGAAVLVFAAPGFYLPRYLSQPALIQVSTDLANPPPFARALTERPRGAPPIAALDERTRELQLEHYPDVVTLELEAPPPQVFEAARALIAERRWRVLDSVAPYLAPPPPAPARPVVRPSPMQRRQPRPLPPPAAPTPPPPPTPGRIEAVARATVFGFRDDVVIRFTGTATQTRVDMRSASRLPVHDLGTNARRVTDFLAALQERVGNE